MIRMTLTWLLAIYWRKIFSYNWWSLFLMIALSLEASVVDYTSNTFCFLTQGIAMSGFIGNYTVGTGELQKDPRRYVK